MGPPHWLLYIFLALPMVIPIRIMFLNEKNLDVFDVAAMCALAYFSVYELYLAVDTVLREDGPPRYIALIPTGVGGFTAYLAWAMFDDWWRRRRKKGPARISGRVAFRLRRLVIVFGE